MRLEAWGQIALNPNQRKGPDASLELEEAVEAKEKKRTEADQAIGFRV